MKKTESYSEPIFEQKVCLLIQREELKRKIELRRQTYDNREKLKLFLDGIIWGVAIGAMITAIIAIVVMN